MGDYEIKVDGTEHAYASGAIRYNKDKGDFNLIPCEVVCHMANDIAQWEYNGRIDVIDYYKSLIRCAIKHQYEEAIILIIIGKYVSNINDRMLEYQAIDVMNGFATMLRDLAIHYQKGARKYGVDNWKKGCEDGTGIPESSFYDSGVRHTLQFLNGETDEPHHISAIWNFFNAIYLRDKLWEH
jgi:hypothetical protein